MLLLHIFIALAGLISTGYSYFSPTENKLRASYLLVALTFATGAYLVWSTHSNMLSACTTGLVYLGVTGTGIVAARTKLALASAKIVE